MTTLKRQMEEFLMTEVKIINLTVFVKKTTYYDDYGYTSEWLEWGTKKEAKNILKKTTRYMADADKYNFGTSRILLAETLQQAENKAKKYFAFYGDDLKITVKHLT